MRHVIHLVAMLAMMISAQVHGAGACCYDSGNSCIDAPDQSFCETFFGGTWLGDGTDCSSVECMSIGACYIFTFEYECLDDIMAPECNAQGGEFLGPLSSCQDEGFFCRSSIGACCIDDTDCWEFTSEEECEWYGGKFFGDGSTCSVDAPWCVMLIGSCCFGDSCMDDVVYDQCEIMGGIFWADDCSLLDDVEMCVPSLGACCFGGQQCEDAIEDADCWSSGGTFYGVGSTCDVDGSECAPYPFGACCFDTGDCLEVDFLECLFSEGDFLKGESCTTVACIGCLADFEPDGVVNVTDLLVVISSWGSPYGVDDLLLVISEWGSSCR